MHFFPRKRVYVHVVICVMKKKINYRETISSEMRTHKRNGINKKRPKIKWSRHNNTSLHLSTPSAARVAWLYVIVKSEFAASTEFSSIFFSINIPLPSLLATGRNGRMEKNKKENTINDFLFYATQKSSHSSASYRTTWSKLWKFNNIFPRKSKALSHSSRLWRLRMWLTLFKRANWMEMTTRTHLTLSWWVESTI